MVWKTPDKRADDPTEPSASNQSDKLRVRYMVIWVMMRDRSHTDVNGHR